MKLILHIGQSKTGTTSLQEFLRQNRAALREKGYLYPDYVYNGFFLNTLNHNSLAEELCGLSRYPCLSVEEYFSQIKEQAASFDCHTIILSAESFFGAPQIWRIDEDFLSAHSRKLHVLKEQISGYDLQIIAYLRRQEDWFDSAVAQVIRYDGLLGQQVYQDDEQLSELLEPHLNYQALLQLWQDTLQPDKMCILPYERQKLIKNNTIYDFMHHVGVDTGGFSFDVKQSQEHASLDRRYMMVKKELNKRSRSRTTERVIIECLNRLSGELDCMEKYKIDAQLRLKIREQYQECNATLAKRYGDEGAQSFFSPKQDEGDSLPALPQEEVDKAMALFWKRYRSLEMRKVYMAIFCKSFLRNRLPAVHAALRRVYLRFFSHA